MLQTLQNFYKATVSTTWAAGTGNRYVSVLPTPTSGRLVINPSDISKREIVSYSAIGTDSGGNYITLSERGVGGTTDQVHAVNEAVRMNLTAQHYSDIQTELDLKLDDSQIDTDVTLAANSDTKVASQKATKAYVDASTALDAQNVKLTGNQTISSGIKTFVESPIVPTPTTSTQAVNKSYADGLAIAGSPDSSTSVKGIGRVSVAPASPTTPIFVGDNDPRVPTQNENDALAGTGTPSGSNKYVTEDYLSGFGDGSDGNVTIAAGTTTLTRDMYYNDLVITGTLVTAGFSVFVKGTVSGAGTIKWGTPNAGSGTTGGAAATGGKYQNLAGGNGSSGGFPGGSAGGAGGTTSTVVKPGVFAFNTLFGVDMTDAAVIARYKGGAGGGGGGSGGGDESGVAGSSSLVSPASAGGAGAGGGFGSGSGGGGGAGGGVVILVAKTWTGTFTIDAAGAAGGNGSGSNGGGGGGGGGGATFVVYNTKTWTGSYNVAGGAGGTGGGGNSGTSGTTGVSYEINMYLGLTR